MDAEVRRKKILQCLRHETVPASATALAHQLEVSRQVIVGDIALLRAQGNEIVATARGYMMSQPVQAGRYLGKIACQHSLSDTEQELLTVIEAGGEVLNVLVEHDLYGEITGQLNVSTQQDVAAFMEKLHSNKARLLSELTGGIHLHSIACKDAAAFDNIRERLAKQGFLYQSK